MKLEIKVRGLEKDKLDYLTKLAKDNKFSSRNDLFLEMIDEYIESKIMDETQNYYRVYMDEMLRTNEFILEQLKDRLEVQNMINERIDKMNILTAQWLDFNEY